MRGRAVTSPRVPAGGSVDGLTYQPYSHWPSAGVTLAAGRAPVSAASRSRKTGDPGGCPIVSAPRRAAIRTGAAWLVDPFADGGWRRARIGVWASHGNLGRSFSLFSRNAPASAPKGAR